MALKHLLNIILLLAAVSVSAQSSKKSAAEAHRLYEDSAYTDAAAEYENSLKINPNQEYLFNLANTFCKLGENEKAKKAYEQILSSKESSDELKSKAAFNLGNLEYEDQKFDQSIQNYKNALDLNPEDEQASENLQIALSKLQQQQQQQQQQQLEQDSEEEQQNQEQPEEQKNNDKDKPAEGKEDPSSSSEEQDSDPEKSKSEKIDLETAQKYMDHMDKSEKKTRERLNQEKNKEKGSGKQKKDW